MASHSWCRCADFGATCCHSQKVNSFGLGIDPAYGTWNEAFDVDLAQALAHFFGPGGVWWDTEEHDSATKMLLEASAVPGEIPEIPESEMQD